MHRVRIKRALLLATYAGSLIAFRAHIFTHIPASACCERLITPSCCATHTVLGHEPCDDPAHRKQHRVVPAHCCILCQLKPTRDTTLPEVLTMWSPLALARTTLTALPEPPSISEHGLQLIRAPPPSPTA
jgi:hypothetical protein